VHPPYISVIIKSIKAIDMRKAISIIFIVIFAPAFFAMVFLLSLKFTLMSSDFIKEELAEQKAYEKIHTNLLEVVNAIGEKDEVPVGDQGALTSKEMMIAIQKAVSPEMAQEKTEMAIDAFWPWIFGDQSEKTVDMRELKSSLRTNVMDTFKSKYESLPYCLDTNDFSDSNMVCRVQGVRFDDVMSQISNDPANNPLSMIDNIPDSLDPEAFLAGEGGSMTEVKSVRSSLRPILNLLYLFPVLLLIIFALLARLFAGSWKKTPGVLGISLLF